MVEPIQEVWLESDERTLVVVGYRGFDMVLHSLELEESETDVGLLAEVAFTPDGARRLEEPSEQPIIHLVGLLWRAEVRLRSPLAGRPVVDRGALQLRSPRPDDGESLSDQVLARLRMELAAAKTPAERRRIRKVIKTVRRNPYKATSLSDMDGGEGGGRSRHPTVD